MDAIGGSREAEAAAFGEITSGEEHPVVAVRTPHRWLAFAGFIEGTGRAWREDRV